MKKFHLNNYAFGVFCGLIAVGKKIKRGLWVIELRWNCPLLAAWSFRLYEDAARPTATRIRLCMAISPVLWLIHWLFLVPLFGILYAVVGTGLSFTMAVGWIFSKVGGWLLEMSNLK